MYENFEAQEKIDAIERERNYSDYAVGAWIFAYCVFAIGFVMCHHAGVL